MSTHGGQREQYARIANCFPHDILDFSVNLNPLGPPDGMLSACAGGVECLLPYPDPRGEHLITLLSDWHGLPKENILLGNGASELIHHYPRVAKGRRMVLLTPTYSGYARSAQAAGYEIKWVQPSRLGVFDAQDLRSVLRPMDLVPLGYVNNPMGFSLNESETLALADEFPECHFLIDESFLPFAQDFGHTMALQRPNVMAIRSLTKILGAGGLRLGYAILPEPSCEALALQCPEWSLHPMSMIGAEVGLADKEYLGRSAVQTAMDRKIQMQFLQQMNFKKVYESCANFVCVELSSDQMSAPVLQERCLKEHRIAIRSLHNEPGLNDRFFRVAVRPSQEQERLNEVLSAVLNVTASSSPVKKRTPAIMIQGTASNAGKSLLCTALGRIFQRRGVRAAPFKAQNMSNNAVVTAFGEEMAQSQALQAKACRVEPQVEMNPILLKPTSDGRSQCVVMGKVQDSMGFKDYQQRRDQNWELVKKAYDRLSEGVDLMIIEGAGSPAEINFRKHDMVNMAMAHHADAAVFVAGDIDRGGVFASMAGTLELLNAQDRARIKGWIINRFRGDVSLLQPALAPMEKITGRPFVGCVPYLTDLDLPSEDSQDLSQCSWHRGLPSKNKISILVPEMPHMANFMDLDPLLAEPEIEILLRKNWERDLKVDVVILPGSKNTIMDLSWLKAHGWEVPLRAHYDLGGEIVGICGGLQMLGKSILDPEQLESQENRAVGLGYLNIVSCLEPTKWVQKTSVCKLKNQLKFDGYEIHHGQTTGDAKVCFEREDHSPLGWCDESERAWGLYLHGCFENDAFRHDLMRRWGIHKGIVLSQFESWNLDEQIDRWADHVEAHLDLEQLCSLAGVALPVR